MIPRRIVWAVPVCLTLHNAEEALALRTRLPTLSDRLPQPVQGLVASFPYNAFLGALGCLTLLVIAVALWAMLRPHGFATWLLAAFQATIALNVVAHCVAALTLRGYAPGLITALLINAPFSWYFFRRASRDEWLSPKALWATLPAAVVLHGPALLGLLLVAQKNLT